MHEPLNMLRWDRRRNAGPRRASLELSEWTQRSAPVSDQSGAATDATPPPTHPVASDALYRAWRAWHRCMCRAYAHARLAFSEWFAWHGNWISHHQRRTVLLCNLVIASLFYPAVVLYLLTTSEDPSSMVNAPVCVMRDHIYEGMSPACVRGAWVPTNIWDVVKASLQDLTGVVRAQALTDRYPVHDLRLVWDETPTLAVVNDEREDAPVVHVAQILVSSDAIRHGNGAPYGVLHPEFLLTALEQERVLDRALLSGTGPSCIRRNGTDDCLVLSPLEFWHRSRAEIEADTHPAKSYTGSPVRAVVTPPVAPTANDSPLPLLYSTTLSGRWPYLPLFSRAEYFVFTYFLHEGHMDAWPDVVRDAMNSIAPSRVQTPHNISAASTLLEFKTQELTARPTINYKVVVVGYLLLITYIFRGLVQMRRLHSRFGIAFTGSAQLVIDLILSLSLCALLGIRLTAVPWPILPFIVVVVGSDTMLYVIRVVTNTPLSLTVNSRIAYGLSQVAGPITFSTATDVALLALVGSFVRNEAIIQFVLFTMCALVADYFMQMTFFITVLSIDIQRLELAEVLMQGTRAPSADTAPRADEVRSTFAIGQPSSGTERVLRVLYRAWRMRSPRAISAMVVAFVACGALVAYGPTFTSLNAVWRYLYRHGIANVPLDAAQLDRSPYGAFWRAVNPGCAAHVRFVLEPWTLVTTTGPSRGAGSHPVPGPWLESLFYDRRSTTIFLIGLFVVAPIALSMAVLSVILNYLLQHSDKLGTQSHHEGENMELRRLLETHMCDDNASDTMSIHVCVHADKLHTSPIVVTAATPEILVSADTKNTVRVEYRTRTTLAHLATLRTKHQAVADASLITALGADDVHGRVALGQQSGRISVWHVNEHRFVDLAPAAALAPVQWLTFCADSVVSLHGDGAVYASVEGNKPHMLVDARPESTWTCAAISATDNGVYVGAASVRGHLVVHRVQRGEAVLVCQVQHPKGTPLRCAALLPPYTSEGSAIEASMRLTPPRNAGRTRSTSSPPTHESATYMLVAGDHDGGVHVWHVPDSDRVAHLALDTPHDGAVRAICALPSLPHALLVQTWNRAWLIEMCTDTDRKPALRVRTSIANVRGSVDAVPAQHNTAWLLGVCRAGESSTRWEVWRAPVASALSTPCAVERVPVDIESLIRTAVRDSVAQGLHPPSRLPLLTTRIDRMVRRGHAMQWVIPFGSTILALDAEHVA